MDALDWLFNLGVPVAHGMCLLWRPDLILLHAGSDAVIALAYFSIPVAILVFLRNRADLQFRWVFWLFAAFIATCGFSHVFGIITIWTPWYGAEGLIKAITALVSIATAVMLWPLLPRALALPSPAQLRLSNAKLEYALRELERSNASLEERVHERTQELEAITKELEERRAAAEQVAADREMLLRELHHRTGNSLQVISSFVSLTLRKLDDPRADEIRDDIQARMTAITEISRQLQSARKLDRADAGVYFAHLIDRLNEGFGGESVEIHGEIKGAFEMDASRLTYLGVIAVELITNAMKHGIKGRPDGRIDIRLERDRGDLILSVLDNGNGYDPIKDEEGSGIGRALIEQFSARLNAKLDYRYDETSGSIATLRAAIDQDEES